MLLPFLLIIRLFYVRALHIIGRESVVAPISADLRVGRKGIRRQGQSLGPYINEAFLSLWRGLVL
jgi:hypothetical protein